jgi:hypothetical protein
LERFGDVQLMKDGRFQAFRPKEGLVRDNFDCFEVVELVEGPADGGVGTGRGHLLDLKATGLLDFLFKVPVDWPHLERETYIQMHSNAPLKFRIENNVVEVGLPSGSPSDTAKVRVVVFSDILGQRNSFVKQLDHQRTAEGFSVDLNTLTTKEFEQLVQNLAILQVDVSEGDDGSPLADNRILISDWLNNEKTFLLVHNLR